MDSPRPSSLTAPSTWYDEVAVPQRNPVGNFCNPLAAVVAAFAAVVEARVADVTLAAVVEVVEITTAVVTGAEVGPVVETAVVGLVAEVTGTVREKVAGRLVLSDEQAANKLPVKTTPPVKASVFINFRLGTRFAIRLLLTSQTGAHLLFLTHCNLLSLILTCWKPLVN
jgi:hypothetical protein